MVTNEGPTITISDLGKKKYKCPKGHKWEAWGLLTCSWEEAATGPLCPFCVRDFLDDNFPAEEIVA